MNNKDLITNDTIKAEDRSLFDRVIRILEETRTNVVRTVNSNMVTAYWLIGREIVLELQGGDERAEYGKQVMENLSTQMTQQYGMGFSVANLKNFRQFYATYADCLAKKSYPSGSESGGGFNPQLSWSHYRALMRVAKYSVLSEGKQIFASKYLKFLPTEEELQREIEKERNLIEMAMLEAGNEA